MSNERHITVVRGRPDAEELAAVTAVLLALVRRARQPEATALAAYANWTVKGGDYRPVPDGSGR
ncbi:acyl-CoA carboxylase subunit epsilon [Streptomyces sp. NPDC001135]